MAIQILIPAERPHNFMGLLCWDKLLDANFLLFLAITLLFIGVTIQSIKNEKE